MAADVIPCQELPGGGVISASVEVAEEGRGCEPASAEVEDEVDQGIKLALMERDFHQATYGRLRDKNVRRQYSLGVVPAYSLRVTFVSSESVAKTNGPESSRVRIGLFAKPLTPFQQFKPRSARFHFKSAAQI